MNSSLIEQGQAALRVGDAATARRAFELALGEGESGEVLEGLAEALYLERDYPGSAARYERAYSAYRSDRQNMAAGRAARTLAWITGNVLGDWAVRSGWLARARTILEEAGQDRPEHGWVLILRAFSEPDAQVRESLLREAIAVGRRFGRSRHRIPGPGLSRRPVGDDRSRRGRNGPLRRGLGSSLCRRCDSPVYRPGSTALTRAVG